jgi:hypothetical protein
MEVAVLKVMAFGATGNASQNTMFIKGLKGRYYKVFHFITSKLELGLKTHSYIRCEGNTPILLECQK